ncbi:helix-turn-helix domain-containing protein [Candidatus Accumulibacter sp. ACC003]|uniref:helix-turn-helix domain-containing protein n=1 Tax=Candidatus Accumulibacter sp. ACC003 TaxID=2823334 RepID=UPI0025BDA61F|nr:helix-turn-helix domain-containing protein [Candidatus Accumulibacter sp. ACC003]
MLGIIREQGPVPSFELTANRAIPKAAARIHGLRARGFNVLTVILAEFEFRCTVRRNVAIYSMGTPEWPAPGFLETRGCR